ncbi:MAG: hypothetical protein ACEPOV_10985 [Hyphomicrobiales bacterium]
MGRYANEDWYIEFSSKLIDEYGGIPPPWIYEPSSHPCSMGWRMGGGETHLDILREWLDQKNLDFNERLEYIRKYPCPPRWYEWVIDFLWDINDDDYLPFFKKLEELGFKNVSDFEKDFNREDLI